jgi:hypothetical protein
MKTNKDSMANPQPAVAVKKPYEQPSFRHERIFETMALACGKINSTQGSCHSNRRTS